MAEAVKEPELSEREKLIESMQQPEASPGAEAKPAEATPEVVASEPTPEEAGKPSVAKDEAKPQQEPPHDDFDWKGATYEERKKRKVLNDLLEAEKKRAADLEAKIKQYEAPKPEEVITDYDKEIFELKRELRAIKETEAERAERERREALERVEKQTRDSLSQVHKDLVSEGYPGFKFAVGEIQNELRRLVAEDEANITLDNPAGWKKIYKEKIFPDLQAEWQETEKRRSVDDKTRLKEQANLASSTGKMPPKPKSDEPKTQAEAYEDAIAAIRKSRGLGA